MLCTRQGTQKYSIFTNSLGLHTAQHPKILNFNSFRCSAHGREPKNTQFQPLSLLCTWQRTLKYSISTHFVGLLTARNPKILNLNSFSCYAHRIELKNTQIQLISLLCTWQRTQKYSISNHCIALHMAENRKLLNFNSFCCSAHGREIKNTLFELFSLICTQQRT